MANVNEFIDVEEIVEDTANAVNSGVVDEATKKSFAENFTNFVDRHPYATAFTVATVTGAGLTAGMLATNLVIKGVKKGAKGISNLITKSREKRKARSEARAQMKENDDSIEE